VGLRALLRRRRELSADAPSQQGATSGFEARWRRGAGADGTPCSGRTAPKIAPNRGSPRAWASAPSCGARASPQPMLHRQQGATSGFEARWRRGAGADGTPCCGRMAPKIAPNSGRPRAWASEPSCGGGASPQPTLLAGRAPRGALTGAGGVARARRAHLAQAEWRLGSPPIGEARGRGPPRPAAAAARALSRTLPASIFSNL